MILILMNTLIQNNQIWRWWYNGGDSDEDDCIQINIIREKC